MGRWQAATVLMCIWAMLSAVVARGRISGLTRPVPSAEVIGQDKSVAQGMDDDVNAQRHSASGLTMISANTRRQLAGAIPLVSGNVSFLIRTLPVIQFLWQYAPLVSWDRNGGSQGGTFNFGGLAVWSLTALGIGIGVGLSRGDRLYEFEKSGRLYKSMGVRLLRRFVTNGDWMVRLMNAVSPGSFVRLGRSSLSYRRQYHRTLERLHWALLGGTLPALVWAMALGRWGYALVFGVLIVAGDLYPIMLQQYSLAVLSRIEGRAGSGAIMS